MADGGIEIRKVFARKNVCESFVDLLCDVRSLIYEAGVQLHETRSGGDFFPRVIGVEDPADADQWDAPACKFVELSNHLSRSICERFSAKSAFTTRRDSFCLSS